MEITKLPLEERLDKIGQSKPAGRLLRSMSCAGFYEGVSLLSKRKYPEWLQSQIESYYKVQPNTPFLLMVDHAQKLIDQTNPAVTGESSGSARLCELMYQLLIEPFYLINQADKEAETK